MPDGNAHSQFMDARYDHPLCRTAPTRPHMSLYRLICRPSRLVVLGLMIGCVAVAPATVSASECCATPKTLADGWEIATPQASGFDAAALDALMTGIAAGPDNIHSVLIERRGKLVAELYRKGPDLPINVMFGMWRPFAPEVDFGPTTLHDTRSISKSVVSLLIGIALEQGRIKSVATPVLDFYPELAALRTPERSAITLGHLLAMTSGLQWDEAALPNDETKLFWKSSPYEFVLSRPIVNTPGRTFHYNSGGTAVLADVLNRVTGKSLTELARTQLFEPLGITDWQWVADLRGRDLAFTGLRMRPRDMLKLGRLVVDKGRWRGKQIVPTEWIAVSARPHISTGFKSPPDSSNPLQYGYQWWTGSTASRSRQVPWSAAFGNGGQRIFTVPELDLIVVITSGDYGSAQIAQTVNRLFTRVVSAIQD